MERLVQDTVVGTLKRRLTAPFYGSFILSWMILHWRGLYGLCFLDVQSALLHWDAQAYDRWQNVWWPVVAAFSIPPAVHLLEGAVRFLIDVVRQLWLSLNEKVFSISVIEYDQHKSVLIYCEKLEETIERLKENHYGNLQKIDALQENLRQAKLNAAKPSQENDALAAENKHRK